QRVARRGLFGLFLIFSGAASQLLVGQADQDLERLVVVRAVGRGELVHRGRLVALLQQLLQAALVVGLQQAAVLAGAPGADELRGGIVAAVEVDGADQRLDRVGQQAGARAPAGGLLSDAEQKMGAEAELLSPGGQARPRDEERLLLRQSPLGVLGILVEQLVRHDRRQHGVAEELEPLVISPGPALAGERLVRQRQLEQVRVLKTIPDDRFERLGQKPRFPYFLAWAEM